MASSGGSYPFNMPIRSMSSPGCYWRQRGNVKDSLGFKSRAGCKEDERVEESGGGKGERDFVVRL